MADAPPQADEKAAAVTGTITASDDDDVALAIVGEVSQDIDPVVEARVIRKIDLFLIPAMIAGYGMVYYDKVLLSAPPLHTVTD